MPVYALDGDEPRLPEAGRFWVAPDAHVIGRVTLRRGVGVWFGAVLRGDREPIVVGEDTNVQDGAVLHTDIGFPLTVGRGCTVGHRAILHGCSIGANTLIGMGAIVMNGASIGANCVVGAGSLVSENKTFPDNSLIVGIPAKLVRNVDPAGVSMLERSAAGYVDNWRRFLGGLRRLD